MIKTRVIATTLAGLLVGLTALPASALAGSVVVFGDEVISHMSASDTNQAERDALAYCSVRDHHCRTIAKCPGGGYGYVAVARINGYIESIGAVCGQAASDTAHDQAVELCRQSAKKATCQIEHAWMDQ